MKEKIDNSVNDWEQPNTLTTEKEKKEWTRNRITSELEGNPNMRPFAKGPKKTKFKKPDKVTESRMKLLDSNGNPIAGYKWGEYNKETKLWDIIPDKDYVADRSAYAKYPATLKESFSIFNINKFKG